MIDHNELLFVVDANDNPLKPLPRNQVIKQRLWRRTTGALVIDKQHQKVLCQKRSELKDERPGLWIADFGGKTGAGETAATNIARELQEELGIEPKPANLHFYKKLKSVERRQFEYLFWLDWDGNIEAIEFEKEEISEVALYSFDQVRALLKGPAKGWYSYGFEIELLDLIEKQAKS